MTRWLERVAAWFKRLFRHRHYPKRYITTYDPAQSSGEPGAFITMSQCRCGLLTVLDCRIYNQEPRP